MGQNPLTCTVYAILRSAICALVPFLLVCLPDLANPYELRVLLGKGLQRVLISGEGLQATDAYHRTYQLGGRIVVEAAGKDLFRLNKSADPVPGPLRISSGAQVLFWDRKPFRGAFELRNQAGHIDVINLVALEDYLAGLVNSEIVSTWPSEAVKAQAVAARTYALWKRGNTENIYDLVATTRDQVFSGAAAEDHEAIRAVRETKGWAMTYQGAPILAYYHSCCGGHTDSAFEIKGKDLPYLKGVECPWCVDCPKFRWNFDLNAQRLAERVSRAGYLIRSVDSLLPVRTTASGRVYELEITSPDKSFFLSGEDLREALGQQELKSTRFQVSRRNKTFHFSGTGYGHGIGACQWGMKGMAEKGHNWRQILKYYYSGVEFVKIEQR